MERKSQRHMSEYYFMKTFDSQGTGRRPDIQGRRGGGSVQHEEEAHYLQWSGMDSDITC